MILGAKGIDSIPMLPLKGVEDLAKGIDSMLKSGQPPEVPIGISGRDLAMMINSLVACRDLLSKVAAVPADAEDRLAQLEALQQEAHNLVSYEPSRIVIPK